MPRKLRLALSPGWLAVHVVAVALIVTMVLLGRWQLDVSNSRHFRLQNFGYAFQWWAFSLFVVFMWARLLRDALRRAASPDARNGSGSQPAEPAAPTTADVTYRRYAIPQSSTAPQPPADALYAEYNDYLAGLIRNSADGPDGTDAERTAQ